MAVNEMEILKFNLKRQNEQGLALVQVIERVEQIESNMNLKYAEVVSMVDEVRDSYTILYEEQKVLQSIVARKSHSFAKEYYENDVDEYGAEIRELAGYTIRHHWKRLKDKFAITRYTSLRRVDFDEAKEFLSNIKLDESFINGFKQWQYQRAKKKEREQKLIKNS